MLFVYILNSRAAREILKAADFVVPEDMAEDIFKQSLPQSYKYSIESFEGTIDNYLAILHVNLNTIQGIRQFHLYLLYAYYFPVYIWSVEIPNRN